MLAAFIPGFSQKLFTRDAKIKFSSDTPMEKIEGLNKSGTCVLDAATGKMEWKVLIKGFLFEKALMQEHFNENYLESSTYPKATFKGKVDNPGALNFDKDGTYSATVSGTMTMHGVSKSMSTPATFTVKGGKVTATAKFTLAMADYNVDVPSLVADKVNKTAAIQITANLSALK